MGWTSEWVDTPFSSADRKARIDRMYNWGDEKRQIRLLKSAMVGSTWYGAVEEEILETGEKSVHGAVVLTQMDGGKFFYKDSSETFGPNESKCPVGILKLLTPTDSEFANRWRERCWKYHESKRNPGRRLNDGLFL